MVRGEERTVIIRLITKTIIILSILFVLLDIFVFRLTP